MTKTESSLYETIAAIETDSALDRDQKINAQLELGLALLAMNIGIVSHIQDGIYTVMYCQSAAGGITPGTTFDLGITYCSLTVKLTTVTLAIPYATNSEYRRHPCREKFGLEAYIGVRFTHADGAYGTLNFSSAAPRKPFSSAEIRTFARLAAGVSGLLKEEGAA